MHSHEESGCAVPPSGHILTHAKQAEDRPRKCGKSVSELQIHARPLFAELDVSVIQVVYCSNIPILVASVNNARESHIPARYEASIAYRQTLVDHVVITREEFDEVRAD